MKILGVSYNFENDLVISLIDNGKFIHSTIFNNNHMGGGEIKKYIECFDVDMIAVDGYGIGYSFYERLKNILEKPVLNIKLSHDEDYLVILNIIKSKILNGVNINISFKIDMREIKKDFNERDTGIIKYKMTAK